jgi:hypothetical protein
VQCGVVVALAVLGSIVSPVDATMVTPTDRVTTYVVVRKSPSTNSQPVGRVDPGDEAESLEAAPRWMKGQLTDGTAGYVSKAWVTESEAEAPPTPVSLCRATFSATC